jgi:hypothetical protein
MMYFSRDDQNKFARGVGMRGEEGRGETRREEERRGGKRGNEERGRKERREEERKGEKKKGEERREKRREEERRGKERGKEVTFHMRSSFAAIFRSVTTLNSSSHEREPSPVCEREISTLTLCVADPSRVRESGRVVLMAMMI